MTSDIARTVAYTAADSQRWALAEADGQIHADLIQSRHFVAEGLITRADAVRLVAAGIEMEARRLADVFKVPFGEVSVEVAEALGRAG